METKRFGESTSDFRGGSCGKRVFGQFEISRSGERDGGDCPSWMFSHLDKEITLGRAAELAGMTRWRFRIDRRLSDARHSIETREGMVIKLKDRIFAR
jgi:hypothetical protein